MTEWRGFLKESKAYMGYGTDTNKLVFWVSYPIAWVKFQVFSRISGGGIFPEKIKKGE